MSPASWDTPSGSVCRRRWVESRRDQRRDGASPRSPSGSRQEAYSGSRRGGVSGPARVALSGCASRYKGGSLLASRRVSLPGRDAGLCLLWRRLLPLCRDLLQTLVCDASLSSRRSELGQINVMLSQESITPFDFFFLFFAFWCYPPAHR